MLYGRHADAVLSRSLSALGNMDDAHDLAQEVFVLTLQEPARIRLKGGSARPWLLATCDDLVRRRLRKASQEPVAAPPPPPRLVDAGQIEERVDTLLMIDRLERAVARMNELDQFVYRSVLHDGHSYEETAAALTISAASVRKRLHRVRHRLREESADEH